MRLGVYYSPSDNGNITFPIIARVNLFNRNVSKFEGFVSISHLAACLHVMPDTQLAVHVNCIFHVLV